MNISAKYNFTRLRQRLSEKLQMMNLVTEFTNLHIPNFKINDYSIKNVNYLIYLHEQIQIYNNSTLTDHAENLSSKIKKLISSLNLCIKSSVISHFKMNTFFKKIENHLLFR